MRTKRRYVRYPLRVRRFLQDRPRAELLAVDWSQTNIALAPLLGLHSVLVGMVRRVLQDEGCRVPASHRGAKVGSYRSRDKYLKAGIGKVPDRVVAQKLVVTRQAVYHMRRMMDIPVLKKAHVLHRLKSVPPARR